MVREGGGGRGNSKEEAGHRRMSPIIVILP